MRFLAWLNRPWLHFILLGLVLFILQGFLFPTPRPVIGPLTEARVEALKQQWLATTGRPPGDEQLEAIISAELDRDMLFQRALELELHLRDPVVYQRLLRNMRFLQLGDGRSDRELYEQALEMRLHLGDEVVKRRMIQVMEQLLLASNPPRQPTEADLMASYEERRDELRRPVRYSIEHLYFSDERRGELGQVVEQIRQQGLSAGEARQFSSPFLPGYRFNLQSADQLARHFGSEFVENFERAGPVAGQWLGPIQSTYGLHYVFVHAIEPARDATLEEVRNQLRRDLESQARAQALARAKEVLWRNYEVRR